MVYTIWYKTLALTMDQDTETIYKLLSTFNVQKFHFFFLIYDSCLSRKILQLKVEDLYRFVILILSFFSYSLDMILNLS